MSASLSVGSAFAALNPPMAALQAAPATMAIPPDGTVLSTSQWIDVLGSPVPVVAPPAEPIPRTWHPPAAHPNQAGRLPDSQPALTGPEVHAALNGEPFHRGRPIFGVVTVTNEAWKPKSAKDVPPSLTDGLGMFLSARWAMLFNASPVACHRRHWACVTNRGTVIVLSGIRLQDRPVDVSGFPQCVQAGLTFHEAEQLAIGANTPRIELARVPREWTIAVRTANTVEAEKMGVAPC
jgi:hypothetical protein